MSALKVIDISPLLSGSTSSSESATGVISELREATQHVGFFYVRGHGISQQLQTRLEDVARRFFALPAEDKASISMSRGGKAWRGYFAVGDELTSGLPDQKEGIYFGSELPEDHPLPLHGPNLWPTEDLGLEMREVVLQYMSELQNLGSVLMLAIAESLGIDSARFGEAFADPTVLFRIFNYPPHNPKYGDLSQAVGEHTDYGYLTILKQDPSGGLQVRGVDGQWIDAPYVEDTFVINLGDALEHCTGGLIKATPHRCAALCRTFAKLPNFLFPPGSCSA
jgi:isopenicillin N synthase-like dioxygenase